MKNQAGKPFVFISGAGLKESVADELRTFCHVERWTGKEPIPSVCMKEKIRRADILILAFHSYLTREDIQAGTHLKLVIQNFAGYEKADIRACTEFGIPFCNASSPSSMTVAEMALTLILASRRRLLSYADEVRAGKWPHDRPGSQGEGHNLCGSCCGILGMGHIGSRLASFLQCLGMHVIYHNRRQLPPEESRGCRWVSAEELYRTSDIIVDVLPASSATRGMINRDVFRQMKKSALFVNVGRGDTVVTDDLVTALQKGHIAQAALDVCDPEPLPADHPLRRMKQVLLTPHVSSSTEEARAEKGRQLIDNIRRALAGQPLTDCVNPEVFQEKILQRQCGK